MDALELGKQFKKDAQEYVDGKAYEAAVRRANETHISGYNVAKATFKSHRGAQCYFHKGGKRNKTERHPAVSLITGIKYTTRRKHGTRM